MNQLLIKEIEILSDKIESEFRKNNIEGKPTIGSLFYTITRGLDNSTLLDMDDQDMITHVRKLQQIEQE